MLKRKIASKIEAYLKSSSKRMMVVDGARQIGKSYIIRHVGTEMFPNFIEVNMELDRLNDRIFAEARTVESFMLALSSIAGEKMGNSNDTLVFIDEIQAYDHLMTLVKFLMEDGRFRYIASGSLLGVSLRQTQSIPVGALEISDMYPLDFEEFLWANGVNEILLDDMRKKFVANESLPEALHNKIMDYFRRYLLVGGLPDAVNVYLSEHNIVKVRSVQRDIKALYLADAAKYEAGFSRQLKIRRIYKMISSYMTQARKRIVFKEIEQKEGKRSTDYAEEFEYLVSSGIALEVDAISRPTYPLIQNAGKNLLKLYLNDVGLLTMTLYDNNLMPVLKDERSVDLGSVYENVVAQELNAHGNSLFYYNNKKVGEVDFLIDDVANLSVLPLEVKSGKDYKVHRALDKFIAVADYHVKQAYVLSNSREVYTDANGVTYIPIYYVMWFDRNAALPSDQYLF